MTNHVNPDPLAMCVPPSTLTSTVSPSPFTIAEPAIETIFPVTKKVAFVGFWEVTRDMAPFDDPTWEKWGCNHGFPGLKPNEDNWSVWFDLHDPEWTKANMKPEVWKDMDRFLRRDHGSKPIYMQRHYPEYPNSIAFPLAEIERVFPVTSNRMFRRYNTNALTYVISMALLRGVTDLALYGADMRGDEEYATQRPAVEYWLGRAEGMGVHVTVPEQSGLLNPDGSDYGYDLADTLLIEMRRSCVERAQDAARKKEEALAAAQTYDGVIQAMQDDVRRIDQRRRGGGAF